MIRNYIKIAFRNLWRKRGFSFLNIAGLAIGMTASFFIFLYVGFELSYDQFHTKGDNIHRVVADIKTPTGTMEFSIPSWAVPPNLEKEFPEIESAVRILGLNMLVRKDDIKFNETNAIAADSTFFKVFDFKLLQGDPNSVIKKPYSIVLSETSSKKYFGDQNPIGKTLKITEEGFVATVTGVMEDIPKNSHINPEMVLSLTTYTQSLHKERDSQWGNYDPAAYILVNPNTDIQQLQAKFPDFLERKNGEEMREAQMQVTLFLEPLKEVYLYSSRGRNGGGSIDNVYIFSIIAIFILLIACINFINLTTARSVERAKEVGIRKVVGAEKGQLAFQFIGESIIISLIAFVITIILTALLLPVFNDLAGKIVSEGILSTPMLILKLFMISLSIGVLAGVYPSFVLSSFSAIHVLKGNYATGTKGVLLRKGLVITQFTISIALIIGTIIIYNQMNFMRDQELGFNKDQILVLGANASPSQKLLQRSIENISGVTSTSLTSSVPGGGNATAYSQLQNKTGAMQIANMAAYFVDENFMPQFDLKVIAGRGFSKDFASDSTQAMIINEEAVKMLGYSSPKEAIGVKFDQWGRTGKIIGVVKDFHYRSLHQNIAPLTIRIEASEYDLITAKVSSQNIKQTIAAIEDSWKRIVPDQPFEYYFLDEAFNEQYESEENFGNLFLNFAILAILISCLGLLGLSAYSTLQRRREIGIRKVVGASVSGIINLLSIDFLKLVLIAFLIASPLAWYMMHTWLQDFAYRINIQWWMFVVAGISALCIAMLTISFHAIKASLINPVKSLRTE
ncbi:ABC transporter permease [Aquimarina sp. RZ0]|uniref:ABC transporter permease n=1 Tax=Aquimarina sp. RZ0 TaxID=2607730 RepID=UPI0011F33DD4|nr:ABC transporter permease [Aquimarina sp. RZ0]KAA1242715.1 FtsX-like permease family protein [Aquimarina sp. RZ0]